ncbi:uncharacterized protein LOC135369068 isoform X1 [Ornithodoros turicata]|uniref:uncharacterized protein LOC135369068 isoform X1 n=1 Tax=Ornithodoros turicata TaxID=34597 RepID=UPI0031387145
MNGVEYGAVARGDVILVSHQETDCDFEYLLKDHLKEFPTDADCRCTRTSGGVTFHFLVSEGLTYTCATTTDVGLRLPFTFLDLTKQRFNVGSLRTRAWTAMEHELNRDFAAVMADIMAKCNEGKMGDHISTLKGQVQEVKVVMTENIEKIVERGERLDTLLDKTQELESSGRSTNNQSCNRCVFAGLGRSHFQDELFILSPPPFMLTTRVNALIHVVPE